MANYYMLGGDGKEYGPTSAEQLRQWVAEGRANAQTQVRPVGGGGYVALGTVPELSFLSGGAMPTSFQPAPAFAQSQGSSEYFMRGGDGKEYGPVSAQLLRQWVAEGRANAQTLVRAANGGPFLALGLVPELNASTGARISSTNLPLAHALAQQSTLGGADDSAQVKRLASVLAAGSMWIKCLAVLMFMMGGLEVITISGIIIAWLPIWLGVTLWSAATKAEQAVVLGSESELSAALDKLRFYFKLSTIMFLVTIIAGVLFVIGVIALGVGKALNGLQ